MDATAPHPLLRRLLHRAEQPGLIPMGLVRRILSQVNALEQRLELLTRLARRYTVRGGFGANQVPIVHALGQPTTGARQEQEQAAATPAQTAVAPERLIVKVSTPHASPAGLNPVTPLSPRTAATAPGGAPSGEARLPTPRVMPLPPVAAATSSGVPAKEPRLSPPPLVTPLPPAAAATSSGVPAREPRLSPPPLVMPLPPTAAATSSGVPAGQPRLSPPLVTPLPPMSDSLSGGVPPGPAPTPPRPPVLLAQPAGATAPHTAPSGEAPPPRLPLTRPLPPVGAPLAGGVPAAAPSPRLPQVTPQPPAEGWHPGGAGTPLVHPQRGALQAGGARPIQEVPSPASGHGPPAVRQATTPSVRSAPPVPAPAPAPRQELDLDVLASKVRQRLLRQFSEERVRRGGLK
jgi:hypothetical protein